MLDRMNAPDPTAIREELQRVLASAGFAQNERLSNFLRFVVERHVIGRDEEIKESVIGVEVFNRRPDYDPKQDSVVRTEAARLRARLTEYYAGEGHNDALQIEVPKGGYTPAFRVVATPSRDAPGRSWRPLALAALGVAVISLAAGAWMVHAGRTPIAIAVLPLENLNRAPDLDYLADGLTDEIIRNVSIIEGLEVRSRTSSFAFKGKPRDARQAGKELAVEYLVEGSVLRVGTGLRIDAELVRVRDDVTVWSRRFDREATDVLGVQDEISTAVVNNLRLRLGSGRRRYEVSAEAYDTYLRARGLQMMPPPGGGAPPFDTAIELYERALRQDPEFAPAYAGLAGIYALRSVQFPLPHPPDELAKMQAAAEKAIQLDPLLAEAHAALGSMYARRGDWNQAERSFRRAIEIDSNRSTFRSDYAYWVLAVEGRLDEALIELRAAERADPLSPSIHRWLANVLIDAGRYEEAVEQCRRSASDETSWLECLAAVRSGQGRMPEVVSLLEGNPRVDRNPQTRGLLGYAYARSGRGEQARQMAERSSYPNEQALIRVGLGDKDGAFEALSRMAALGAQRVGLYLNSPEFALLRGDPRLSALHGALGLPEPAKSTR